MSAQAPFVDPAQSLLAQEPTIDDAGRADLWDVFHNSKSPSELAQKLQPLAVPDDLKQKLFAAKKGSVPVADRVSDAVHRLNSLDHEEADFAEAHPNLLKAFTTPEKEATAAPAGPAAAGGGKTATAAPKAPAPADLPPRADGQPHMPPIPEGHKRLLASDGSVHDLPEENIEK